MLTKCPLSVRIDKPQSPIKGLKKKEELLNKHRVSRLPRILRSRGPHSPFLIRTLRGQFNLFTAQRWSLKTNAVFIVFAIVFSYSASADLIHLDLVRHQWKRELIAVVDSRPRIPDHSPSHPQIEIAELPYESAAPKTGAMLMIPGFFQNANSFDLLPAEHISFARYLSRTFHLQIYFLHIRGLGDSSLGKDLNLDDFAIDDLPAAIDFISKKENAQVIVFGNSQGGIMLQATLSGLTRCGDGNCFDENIAIERQKKVKALALSGGSASLTHEKNTIFFPGLLELYQLLQNPLRNSLDYINIDTFSQNPILRPLAQFPFWRFLYNPNNVTNDARTAMFDETLEATWAGVVLQFGDGIEKSGVRTQSARPVAYTSGFKNIHVSTVQVTYELDPFAEPGVTERDSYAFIGSQHKHFFVYPNQSHEDYLMAASLHHDWDAPMNWLLGRTN